MTKPLEFGDKVRQIAKDAGRWCNGCGIAGVSLEGDHIIPREIFQAGKLDIIAKLVPALAGKSSDDIRAYMVSIENFQWLCVDCHNAKSRVDQKGDKIYRGIGFAKPTFTVPVSVTHFRDNFKKTLYAPKTK